MFDFHPRQQLESYRAVHPTQLRLRKLRDLSIARAYNVFLSLSHCLHLVLLSVTSRNPYLSCFHPRHAYSLCDPLRLSLPPRPRVSRSAYIHIHFDVVLVVACVRGSTMCMSIHTQATFRCFIVFTQFTSNNLSCIKKIKDVKFKFKPSVGTD